MPHKSVNARWISLLLPLALSGCESPESAPEPLPTPESPSPVLTVELTDVWSKTIGPEGMGECRATVRFRNHGTDSVWILSPLDGSRDGRLMPFYKLTVTGPTEPPDWRPRMCGLCGRWSNTQWPRDYLIEVRAGDKVDLKGVIGSRLWGAGRYTLQFDYVYIPGANGHRPPDDLPPPAQAWRGKVSAPAFVLNYRPDPNWRPEELGPPADSEP